MAKVPDQAPLAVQVEASALVQVRVALCPGMTELGLRFMVTSARSGGGVIVIVFVGPLLQPERTKAERRTTAGKEVSFLAPVGNCITPPFA